MNKQIFIINDSGRVGKDTFVDFIHIELNRRLNKYHTVSNFSSVDRVKEVAEIIGWCRGSKSEKDRKFLFDLKKLTGDYCDMPFESMKRKVDEFKMGKIGSHLLFLHIREPEEIERAVKEFGAKIILMTRESINHITSNESDKNVFNYQYDIVIENNGDLSDLRDKAIDFIDDLLETGKQE